MPEVTQLINDRAGIETWAFCRPGLCVLNHDAMLPLGYSEDLVEQKALYKLIVVYLASICQPGTNKIFSSFILL